MHFWVDSRQTLLEAEERLKRLFEVSPIGILLAGPDMQILRLSYVRLQLRRRCSAWTFPLCFTRIRGTRSDGQPGCAQILACVIEQRSGFSPLFLLLFDDVTEIKRTEAALRQGEDRIK